MSTESEQLVWKGEGLPSDDLSVENALVILQVCKLASTCVCVGVCARTHNVANLFGLVYRVNCAHS